MGGSRMSLPNPFSSMFFIPILLLGLSGCTLSYNISDLNKPLTNSSSTESSLSKMEQINMTNYTINEYQPLGSLVGELTALSGSGNAINAHFSLVDENTYSDNQFFEINGNQLTSKAVFHYSIHNFYVIKIKAQNSELESIEKIFNIAITNVNLNLFINPIFYISSGASLQITPDYGSPLYQYTLISGSLGTLTSLGNYTAPNSSSALQSSQVNVLDNFGETQTITLHTPPAGSVDLTYQSGDMAENGMNQFNLLNASMMSSAVDTNNNTLAFAANGANKFLVRIKPDGNLDSTFGISGKIDLSGITSSTLNYMTLDHVNNIYIAGGKIGGSEIFRYTPTGTLDTSFGTSGMTIACSGCSGSYSVSVYAMSFDSSNNFYVVGGYTVVPFFNSANFIQKFTASGSADPGFNSGNPITSNPTSGSDLLVGVAVDSNGKAITAGYQDWFSSVNGNSVLKRFTPTGAMDINSTFDASGASTMDGVYLLKVDSLDRFYLVIYNGPLIFVRRYLTNGTLDTSFASGGIFSINLSGGSLNHQPVDILIDNLGRIVVCARHQNFDNLFFFRLNPNGTLDNNWGTSGILTIDPNPLANDSNVTKMTLLPNKEILVLAGKNGGSSTYLFKLWP